MGEDAAEDGSDDGCDEGPTHGEEKADDDSRDSGPDTLIGTGLDIYSLLGLKRCKRERTKRNESLERR